MDRIYKLDRVRYLCNHSAELSMGYVEIGHLVFDICVDLSFINDDTFAAYF